MICSKWVLKTDGMNGCCYRSLNVPGGGALRDHLVPFLDVFRFSPDYSLIFELFQWSPPSPPTQLLFDQDYTEFVDEVREDISLYH